VLLIFIYSLAVGLLVPVFLACQIQTTTGKKVEGSATLGLVEFVRHFDAMNGHLLRQILTFDIPEMKLLYQMTGQCEEVFIQVGRGLPESLRCLGLFFLKFIGLVAYSGLIPVGVPSGSGLGLLVFHDVGGEFGVIKIQWPPGFRQSVQVVGGFVPRLGLGRSFGLPMVSHVHPGLNSGVFSVLFSPAPLILQVFVPVLQSPLSLICLVFLWMVSLPAFGAGGFCGSCLRRCVNRWPATLGGTRVEFAPMTVILPHVLVEFRPVFFPILCGFNAVMLPQSIR
jgi:hypothetical protein